jgi:hypothetical protein
MSKPDPVEIVAIAVPLLCEALAVLMFLAMAVVWVGIAAGAI